MVNVTIIRILLYSHSQCLYTSNFHFECSGHLHTVMQFDESNTYIEGLAYDWLNHNLYYTDAGSAQIGVVSITASWLYRRFKKVLLGPSQLGKPRGIAVHPSKGYVFCPVLCLNNRLFSRFPT